ncbi:hypothetical protein PTKIN_Ptkin05aG0155400 [Pterospermum kingtungense]
MDSSHVSDLVDVVIESQDIDQHVASEQPKKGEEEMPKKSFRDTLVGVRIPLGQSQFDEMDGSISDDEIVVKD